MSDELFSEFFKLFSDFFDELSIAPAPVQDASSRNLEEAQRR